MLIVFFHDLFQFEFFGGGMCVQVSVGAHRPEASDSLELEWQAIVNFLLCKLGTKGRSFARAVHSLKFWAISPAWESKILVWFNMWKKNLIKHPKGPLFQSHWNDFKHLQVKIMAPSLQILDLSP